MEGSPRRSCLLPSLTWTPATPGRSPAWRIRKNIASAGRQPPTQHMQESPASPLEGSCCPILLITTTTNRPFSIQD